MLDSFELSQCQMQGHLFELSAKRDYDSESFINAFMNSDVAYDLDKLFNHMQWAGESYLISRLSEENPEAIKKGELLDNEILFWSGYVYRYWHFYSGESSKTIFKQAPVSVMKKVYLPYHTMSVEMAIDRLKETFQDKRKKRK